MPPRTRQGRRPPTVRPVPPAFNPPAFAKICVPLRCDLCRFPFNEDEIFIAISENGARSTTELRFTRGFRPPSSNILYSPCSRGCPNDHNGVFKIRACHVGCIAIVDQDDPPLDSYLKATSGNSSHDLGLHEDKRRLKWLKNHFAPTLIEIFPQLPAELCLMVASYCIREHSVQLTKNFLTNTRDACEVSTAKNIWAEYCDFEGIPYLVSLSNKPVEGGGDPILTAKRVRAKGVFYIAEDPLGIRDIRFVKRSNREESLRPPAVEAVPGIWWRTVPTLDTTIERPRLYGWSDGFKLRTVKSNNSPALNWSTSWAIPQELGSHPLHHQVMHLRENLGVLRMSMLQFNRAEIKGYSFCWTRGLTEIYLHRSDTDHPCYEDPFSNPKDRYWFYMPINEGELISRIWMFRYLDNPSAVIFRTNKGYTTVVGPYPKELSITYQAPLMPECRLMFRRGTTPDRMFFHDGPGVIRALAFDGVSGVIDAGSRPQLLDPVQLGARADDYPARGFHSFASLADVVKVTPCRRIIKNVALFCGLIFEYRSGRRACIGQIRLDSLEETLTVKPGDRLYLGTRKPQGKYLRVISCSLGSESPPRDYPADVEERRVKIQAEINEEFKYIGYPLQGTLEWRVSREQDFICYHAA